MYYCVDMIVKSSEFTSCKRCLKPTSLGSQGLVLCSCCLLVVFAIWLLGWFALPLCVVWLNNMSIHLNMPIRIVHITIFLVRYTLYFYIDLIFS